MLHKFVEVLPSVRTRTMDCLSVFATLSLLLVFVDGASGDTSSAVDQRQRCEEHVFVSLDAVGMSERPCWTVCPPVKSLPMHRKFCQRNCPEYFQECVSVPNVGRSSGPTGDGTEGGMEGHVTLKVFIIVSVVLSAVIIIVVIVAACCVKHCIGNIISRHCKCRQTSKIVAHHKEEYASTEAETLMIRSTAPPCYDHENDGRISNLDRQAELVETTGKRNSMTKTAIVDLQNVTTAAEVHSTDCNSNIA